MTSEFLIFGELRQRDKHLATLAATRDHGDYPRQDTGEYPVEFPPAKIVQAAKELGLFNGFRIGSDPWAGKVTEAELDKYYLQIDLLRATRDYKRPGYPHAELPYEEFVEKYYDNAFDLVAKYPERVFLCAVGEIDSSCPWPRDRYFQTKEEAHAFFQHGAFHLRVGSCDPETFFGHLRKRNLDLARGNVMIHGACLFAVHYYFEWGFPLIEIERGLGASLNMQVSMGYLRGAWRQHGRKSRWGVDYSTHHPNRNQCTWYDAKGRRCGGYSESLMLRTWIYTYLSGAHFLLEEASDFTHWVFQEDGSFRLSGAGEAAKRFADFALRGDIDRGEPVSPVAVMLDYYNGFSSRYGCMPRQPSVWGNRLPCQPEDLHIANTLEIFYPGFQRVYEDTDGAANPDLPWRTQWEYLDMLKSGFDMRPYEKGQFVPSPHGDCLEVILDNSELDVLRHYNMIILAGRQRMADCQDVRLLEFVREGGVLAAALNQLSTDMTSALGIESLPPKDSDWDYDYITIEEDGTAFGNARYAFSRLAIANGRTLARNSRGITLIWEVPYGQGKVILSAIPYAQDVSSHVDNVLPAWAHIMGKLADSFSPVAADIPGLQICVNRTSRGWLVGAFNNQDKLWRGTIRVRAPLPGLVATAVKDLWAGKKDYALQLNASYGWEFAATLPGFDFCLFSVEFSEESEQINIDLPSE
jgi:hypothetical protein